ncbi:MAG: MoxR family ATPase [Verrucomicrobiota bacterium]|nr:MoxR family ATPase [Verrucomicrobiota bacterium]
MTVPLPPPPSPEPQKRARISLPPILPAAPPAAGDVRVLAQRVIENVETVIVGKREQITLALAVLLAEGHLLVEDVPGVAKTMLARAIAASAGCSFKRIQCTPDLQPQDVLGEASFDAQTGRTEFRFGPLFSQFVLVDEINRASPRTQSALLEAMGEGMVTAGNVSYRLQKPFMVMATQNPVEQEGTFRLPEAQKDRFLARMSIGYPSAADEKRMVERFRRGHPIEALQPVATPDLVLKCQEATRGVPVADEVNEFILHIVRATRSHPALVLGASPRASLGLYRAGQAMAAIRGEDRVSAALIGDLAAFILPHRLIVRGDGAQSNRNAGEIVGEIVLRPGRAA